MRNTVIWSFLSLVALGVGGLVSGCDSDAKLSKSALGESCAKTSDCDDGLKCIQDTCYKSSTSSGGSANNEGGDGTGATPPAVVPPVLGDEGESCTKRADCKSGLGCFSQRCTKAAGTGEGGEGNVPVGPTLGAQGETCGLTTDCEKGLACLPSDGISQFPEALANGTNTVGVCTPVDNGLQPTGNQCGAECKTAADCCELPVAVHEPYAAFATPGVSGPWGAGANSCTQLAALLDGIDCETTKIPADQSKCFAQSAYCVCGKTTWTCSDAGRCVYNAACGANGAVNGGCPTYTRTSAAAATPGTCDLAGTKKCEPAAVDGCKVDKDCDAKALVADSEGRDTCADGKCTCQKSTGLCYRSCGEDLDCPVSPKFTTCDTKLRLCVTGAECTTDSFCVTKNNDINSKCSDGTCKAACSNDLDCNGGRLTNSSGTRICNASHVCELAGCESDDQCDAVGGVRTFCTKAPAEVAGTGAVISAVTD